MKAPTAHELALILWRRKLWVLVPVILGLAGGYAATRMIAPTYFSSAEILIEPPKVAEGLVKTITTMDQEQRLNAVRSHITARDRIERLVDELRADPDLVGRAARLAVEEIRSALVVRVARDATSVSIQLTGGDPYVVAAAVNWVAEEYVETNSQLRGVESEGTVDFMQSQLDESRRRLDEHEAKIARFKADNFMRLPEQRGPHSRTLERLESEKATIDNQISTAEKRLAMLRSGIRPSEDTAIAATAEQQLLAQRRQELRQLQRSFTDQYPDVIRLKREIEALEEEVRQLPVVQAPTPEAVADPLTAAQIEQLGFEIEDRRNERMRVEAEIRRYRSYLAQIPAVEQQLQGLEREHANLSGWHRQNLKQTTEIGVAEDLEKGDFRETLRIVEPAVAAVAPFSPNKPLLMLIGLALGGALGAGLALLREHTSGGFEGPAELSRAFPGVRVLNSIPRIQASSLNAEPVERERRSA